MLRLCALYYCSMGTRVITTMTQVRTPKRNYTIYNWQRQSFTRWHTIHGDCEATRLCSGGIELCRWDFYLPIISISWVVSQQRHCGLNGQWRRRSVVVMDRWWGRREGKTILDDSYNQLICIPYGRPSIRILVQIRNSSAAVFPFRGKRINQAGLPKFVTLRQNVDI